MTSIAIRALEPDEWEVLRDLCIRALMDAPDAFSPTAADAQGRPDAYWVDALRTLTRGGHQVFAAWEDGRSLGLVSATVARGVGHIGAMWVDPACRGLRLGRRLLEVACDALVTRGCARIELSVTEGNEVATRLYQEAGFSLTGEAQPLREGSPLRNLSMAKQVAAPAAIDGSE